MTPTDETISRKHILVAVVELMRLLADENSMEGLKAEPPMRRRLTTTRNTTNCLRNLFELNPAS